MDNKPYVWQMIKEAVENLGGKASYSEIKDCIKEKYGEVNESTINSQIVVYTVNHPSRIHYPENKNQGLPIQNTIFYSVQEEEKLNYTIQKNTGCGKLEKMSMEN